MSSERRGTTQWGLVATPVPICVSGRLFSPSRTLEESPFWALLRKNRNVAPDLIRGDDRLNQKATEGYGFTSGGTSPAMLAATFSADSIARSRLPPAIFSQSASE